MLNQRKQFYDFNEFRKGACGMSNVWKQPLAGSEPMLLTDCKADRMVDFIWTADGKSLLCFRAIDLSCIARIGGLR